MRQARRAMTHNVFLVSRNKTSVRRRRRRFAYKVRKIKCSIFCRMSPSRLLLASSLCRFRVYSRAECAAFLCNWIRVNLSTNWSRGPPRWRTRRQETRDCIWKAAKVATGRARWAPISRLIWPRQQIVSNTTFSCEKTSRRFIGQ